VMPWKQPERSKTRPGGGDEGKREGNLKSNLVSTEPIGEQGEKKGHEFDTLWRYKDILNKEEK